MINNELDYEIDEDDKDKEQCTHPSKEVDSQKDASKKAVDKWLGDSSPLLVPQVIKCYCPPSTRFNSQYEE
ncbi:hypothetical protein ES703_117522 [subsurface metagenome]